MNLGRKIYWKIGNSFHAERRRMKNSVIRFKFEFFLLHCVKSLNTGHQRRYSTANYVPKFSEHFKPEKIDFTSRKDQEKLPCIDNRSFDLRRSIRRFQKLVNMREICVVFVNNESFVHRMPDGKTILWQSDLAYLK